MYMRETRSHIIALVPGIPTPAPCASVKRVILVMADMKCSSVALGGAVLDDPGVGLDLLEGYPLFGVQDEELGTALALLEH